MKKLLFLLFFALVFFPVNAFAKIGVGVATGKINVQEKLKPGIIYNLPPLTVLNTGDVPSDYEVSVTYFEKQPQLKPPNEWFIFSPKSFRLNPGEVQIVNAKLNLPISATPGDYFGFLEAHPIQTDKSGQTTIGIAAATKLYFTIVPANIFQGIYYKIISFWSVYSPWTNWSAVVIGLIIFLILFKKFFRFELSLKQRNDEQKPKPNE